MHLGYTGPECTCFFVYGPRSSPVTQLEGTTGTPGAPGTPGTGAQGTPGTPGTQVEGTPGTQVITGAKNPSQPFVYICCP